MAVAALVACGPNSVDEARRDALAGERIVFEDPPGTLRSGSVEVHPPVRDELTLEYGPNLASRRVTVDPDAPVRVLDHYLDELSADGWKDIHAICRPPSEDRSALATVSATKRVDDFTAMANVSISYAHEDITVRIALSAPFHGDDGESPAGVPARVPDDCALLP